MQCQCKRCERLVSSEHSTALWDGHHYCKICIDSVSPRLFEFAKAHTILEETAPFDRRAHWLRALKMEAIVFAVFGSILSIGGFQQSGMLGALVGLAVCTVVCGFQGGLQLPMFVWLGRFGAPTIIVRSGQVECFRGGNRNRFSRTLGLKDVKWRLGKSKHDTGLRNTFFPPQPVVILVIPIMCGRYALRSDRYACGWSPEMREIWMAFLSLAEVERA